MAKKTEKATQRRCQVSVTGETYAEMATTAAAYAAKLFDTHPTEVEIVSVGAISPNRTVAYGADAGAPLDWHGSFTVGFPASQENDDG